MDKTTSSTSSASRFRAACHPRRRTVAPEHRKRVSTACNSCSLRRIKCSGERPCSQCARSSRPCQYPEGSDRVSLPRAELEALQKKCDELEQRLQSPNPSPASVNPPQSPPPTQLSAWTPVRVPATASPSTTALDQNISDEVTPTEGRLLHDPDGVSRYFGESSGANFLNHVKEFIATLQPLVSDCEATQSGRSFLASVGSYQTWDSRVLRLHQVDPSWLPNRTSITVLLTEFRYFVQDGNGDFPTGGIFYWGDIPSVASDPQRLDDLRSSRHLAFLHVVLAVAVHLGASADWNDESTSEAFFSRARLILGNPLDIAEYSTREIPVLLLMALYLIEMNRRDAAYMTVSMALHLAVVYGSHTDCGQNEGARRVFWTLYILDCWLSSWLGRPPSITDSAIRLDLPGNAAGLPNPAGLRSHVELAKISRHIICNIYRVAPWDQSSKTTTQHVKHGLELLHQWLSSLPLELCLDYNQLSQDRSCCVLHLTYNQNVILTTRPIFFVTVRKVIAARYLSYQSREPTTPYETHAAFVDQCRDTARQNLVLGRWIRGMSPRHRIMHHEAHAIFNAAIVLLLHQLAFVDPDFKDDADIRFAIEVFNQEAASGNNFGIDCATVLEDLSSLVHGAREHILSLGHPATLGTPSTMERQPPLHLTRQTSPATATCPLEFQSIFEQNNTLQRELQDWLDIDYLQLYDEYLV